MSVKERGDRKEREREREAEIRARRRARVQEGRAKPSDLSQAPGLN